MMNLVPTRSDPIVLEGQGMWNAIFFVQEENMSIISVLWIYHGSNETELRYSVCRCTIAESNHIFSKADICNIPPAPARPPLAFESITVPLVKIPSSCAPPLPLTTKREFPAPSIALSDSISDSISAKGLACTVLFSPTTSLGRCWAWRFLCAAWLVVHATWSSGLVWVHANSFCRGRSRVGEKSVSITVVILSLTQTHVHTLTNTHTHTHTYTRWIGSDVRSTRVRARTHTHTHAHTQQVNRSTRVEHKSELDIWGEYVVATHRRPQWPCIFGKKALKK